MIRQDQTPPFDHRGTRVNSAVVDSGDVQRQWPMRPVRPAPGVADSHTRMRYDVFDYGILRDNTPYYQRQHYVAAGHGVASWAAFPARPALNQRNVTVNRRVGTSATRHLVDPRTGTTGLVSQGPRTGQGSAMGYHTQATGRDHPSTTVPRYSDSTLGTMSRRRQNRLSPARYNGQSYSQTTLLQGGNR